MRPKLENIHFGLITQRDAVIVKGQTMVKIAERACDIATSGDEFRYFFANYAELIHGVLERGVKIRVVLGVNEYDEAILRVMEMFESPNLELKLAEQPLSHYLITDHKEALIATSVEPNALGKSYYLWTDDTNLIKLLQRDFESTWRSALKTEAVESQSVNEQVIRLIKDLKPTNHAMLLYESTNAKHNILFNYVKMGLDNGEAVVYIASEESPSQLVDAMRGFGIDVDRFEGSGALQILRCDEFYIVNGGVDPQSIYEYAKKMHAATLNYGFKGCRFVGEMSCFFKGGFVEELMRYEKGLHRILDIPVIALCAYNKRLIKEGDEIDLYNEMLKNHTTTIFAGRDDKTGKIEVRST
jgi:hypothetical protein